jgi:flagellin
MNAHSNAVANNRMLDSSLKKLSSGLRINNAADDASGLSIANSLRSQASSLGQSIANGNDAIGLIQTADGALSEYGNILNTIKTKATQAASDTQNSTSRQAIQKDIDKLMEELDTIATTTSFNGQKLLSGTYANKEFQMGSEANQSVKLSIASTETSQIGQTTRATLNIAQEGQNQLTLVSAITGESLTLASIDIQNNNNADNGLGALADSINRYSGNTGITAKAVVEATAGPILAGSTGDDFAINGVSIGNINVTDNDSEGTLLNAINSKTTSTGITATKTEDGRLTLSSVDGRGLEVTGNTVESVINKTTDEMTTIGNIEVVQVGSSAFRITGAELGAAVGEDTTTTGTMTTVQDSTLTIGSTIISDSVMAAGTTLGVNVSANTTMEGISSTKDTILAVGSVIGSGAQLEHGTVLGTTITTRETVTLTADMLLKAGSVLGSNTVFDAGTVLQQDITVANVDYKAGTTLVTDLTLTSSLTLAKDMTMTIDIQNQNAALASGSKLLAGTVLGEDIVTTGSAIVSTEMVAKAGTSLVSGSVLAAGSIIGDKITVSGVAGGGLVTTEETNLKVGSTIGSGSILKEDSTIGGELTTRADVTLNQDMVIKAGSTLATATVLKAGTIINQDLTDAQVGGGTGSGLKAGTTLGTDITLTDQVAISKDFVMNKGETGTNALLKAGSILAANGGGQNSVTMSDTSFTNLSSIDVRTLEGAMKAIDTVSAAITNLDTIRSDMGSVQNQVTSTVNNISVTQVNVTAAESAIRDVDFAAESANFSKFNILAQSGSYAMSQANSVQQNVMRLLQ